MSEQEKSLYNLVKDFIHAVKLDQHDWEDWPEDSREAFEKMQEINKPVVECQHCNGLGCITKTIGTNVR